MSMSEPLNHLKSIWYHSKPLEVPYSPNQFLGWDFFWHFLQQTGSNMDCCLPSTNIFSALVRTFFNPQLNLIAAYIHAKIIICKYDHLMKCIQQPVTCSKQPLQLKHIQFNSMHNIPIHVQNLQLSLRSIFWSWQGTLIFEISVKAPSNLQTPLPQPDFFPIGQWTLPYSNQ